MQALKEDWAGDRAKQVALDNPQTPEDKAEYIYTKLGSSYVFIEPLRKLDARICITTTKLMI